MACMQAYAYNYACGESKYLKPMDVHPEIDFKKS